MSRYIAMRRTLIFTFCPRLFGMPVALNVDGLERNRKKWNRLAKTWYLISERLATVCPNTIVTDARKIAEYYFERYRRQSEFIPYGAEIGKVETAEVLDRLGLERSRYFLYVSRMEPENNALLVREAFEQVVTPLKLALIGDAPYAQAYIERVRDTKDPRVVMPGAIYGRGYHELESHCFAYIHATEVGGTHPALIEAMGRGALVLYLNTPENDEVAGGAGIPFEAPELAAKLREVLFVSEAGRSELSRLRHGTRSRALQLGRRYGSIRSVAAQTCPVTLSLRTSNCILVLEGAVAMKSLLKFGSAFLVLTLAVAVAQPRKGRAKPLYDPATEKTISGEVLDVQQTQRGRVPGLHLMVKTESETVDVRLGPATFVQNQGFTFAKGDKVEILGSKVTVAGTEVLIAREVTKDGKKLTLRDNAGRPMWSGGRT